MDIIESFDSKQTHIAQGEALAVLFFLYHERNAIRGSSIIHFIDNLGVLSAYCKGSSTLYDIAHIVSAALILEAGLNLRSWKEHVDSGANLADGGTKNFFEDTNSLNVQMTELPLPPWPRDLRRANLDFWLSFLPG
jgi:hypothetical protein